MKKVFVILSVLIVACLLFCGAAAAFTYDSEAKVTPSENLKVGTKATADMVFYTKGSEIPNITFYTPLDTGIWDINIYQGKTRLVYYTPTGNSFTAPSWPFNENVDVRVIVTLTGNVTAKFSGKDVTVLTISAKDGQVYSTPLQHVDGNVLVREETKKPTPEPTPYDGPLQKFTYEDNAYSVNPAQLSGGKYVTGKMTLHIPKRIYTDIKLTSPLERVHFEALQVCKDGRKVAFLQQNGSPYIIPASSVYLDEVYDLQITFTGTVPDSLNGKAVSLLNVDAGDYGSYISPEEIIGNGNSASPVVTQNPQTVQTQPAAPTQNPVSVQTENPAPEEQSTDIISMIINWFKSLFGAN